MTALASVIFKKYPKKQETQYFYLKKEIKRERVQPAQFQFLKKNGTTKKKTNQKFGKTVCKSLDNNMQLKESQKSV